MVVEHEGAHHDDHDHDHDHGHEHEHEHEHDHADGHERVVARIARAIGLGHSHDPAERVDSALEESADGIRALKISLVGLGITAVLQAIVVIFSHSVALLGDTLHNVADALTALPLWVAFVIGRRARNRRYTYGYGRAEDLAGLAIVGAIAASSLVAGWESMRRLVHPTAVHHLVTVMIASVIGFAGNEIVAQYRIAVGRRIGSAALVADGLHARTDGMTSLAVLVGAIGVALGWKAADPLVGIIITVAILFVLRGAARDVYRRLMDAVDPSLVDRAERVLAGVEGVEEVSDVRIRWIGHRLRAEVELLVDARLNVVEGHRIADSAYHALLHDVPRLTSALVHVSPHDDTGVDHHDQIGHHHHPDW